MRNRRFQMFEEHLKQYNGNPVKILDVGGTQSFWENRGYVNRPGIYITLLNVYRESADYPNIKSTVGTGADLSRFKDNEFDIAFSNSVIEHLETWEEKKSMAEELKRVGKSYYIQTPNKYFPVECHFLVPFFQFLPFRLKYFLLTRTKISKGKVLNRREALKYIKEIKLLSRRDLKKLFPGDTFKNEKFFGFNKSFIIHHLQK
jgi:hypothetical protein